MNHLSRLLVPALVAVLVGCSTSPGAPSDTAVIIPDTTKVADPTTRAALTAYDADTGVLRFSQGSPGVGKLKSGDVLVSEPSAAAPSGYLRKVTAVRQDGADTVLDTTQANLTDAITQGELNADFQLTGDDLLRTEGLPEGATLTANPAPSGGIRSQAGVGENYGFTLNFNHTFVPVKGPNAIGTIKVDGGVNFNVGYGVNVGIKPCFELPPVCVKSFQASVGFAQGSHLNITGDFQGAVGDAVLVGTQYFRPKVFFIGPVPVVLVPKVELYLTAGGEIKAHVNFAASESVTAQVGARWTKGQGWKDISGFGLQGNVAPPTFTGSLSPRVGVQSRASFTLYDVAGPEATLEGGVKLDVAYPRNPNWIVNGFLKGALGFRVRLPILGTLASYNTTLFDISKELGRSASTPPVLTLTNRPHSVNVGTPQNFRAFCSVGGPTFGNGEFFTASDAEDGCGIAITVVSDRDGPLTPDFTFSSLGLRHITVTARDSQGATTSLSFDLDVVNPAPTLTINSTGDPHQGEAYLMSASVTDSNEPAHSNLCNFTTWVVDAPDSLSTTTGCDVKVTFGATGARQVRVTTHDSYGATASKTVTLNVLPPPVNPYPKVISAGVVNREYRDYLHFGACSFGSVTDGSLLDLTLRAGYFCPAQGPTIYFATVTLENPQNEPVTYDWKLFVSFRDGEKLYDSSNQAVFNLSNGGGQSPATFPCRVTLTVGAPDPSRSKSLTVWSGQCTIMFGQIVK